MKQITTLALANEVIAKLSSVIEYEYDFAKFNRYEYALDRTKFDDENEQHDYLLWSYGRLAAMEKVKEKTDKIFEDAINDLMRIEES